MAQVNKSAIVPWAPGKQRAPPPAHTRLFGQPVQRVAFHKSAEVDGLWDAAQAFFEVFNKSATYKIIPGSLLVFHFVKKFETASPEDLQLVFVTMGSPLTSVSDSLQKHFAAFAASTEKRHHMATRKHVVRSVSGQMLHELSMTEQLKVLRGDHRALLSACKETSFTTRQTDGLVLSVGKQHLFGGRANSSGNHLTGQLQLGAPPALHRMGNAVSNADSRSRALRASASSRGGGPPHSAGDDDSRDIDGADSADGAGAGGSAGAGAGGSPSRSPLLALLLAPARHGPPPPGECKTQAVPAAVLEVPARDDLPAPRADAVLLAQREAAVIERERLVAVREQACLLSESAAYTSGMDMEWAQVASAAQAEMPAMFPDAKELLKEMSTSSAEARRHKMQQDSERQTKGKRKRLDDLIFCMPPCVLEEEGFLKGLSLLAEAAQQHAQPVEDPSVLFSVASRLLRRCSEEIICQRLLNVRQRLVINKQSGTDRRELRATRGRMATEVFQQGLVEDLERLGPKVNVIVQKLSSMVISHKPRVGTSGGSDGITCRQLVAFTAAPAGDIRGDNFYPDLISCLLSSMLSALLHSGDINDQLFVMLLLHAECVQHDALYDREELACARDSCGSTRDPRFFASAINSAMHKPGIERDCEERNPEMAIMRGMPGWPGKYPDGVEGLTLEGDGASSHSRFYQNASGQIITADDKLFDKEWGGFVWDPNVPILTIVFSATGSDNGLQLCRSTIGRAPHPKPVKSWPGWTDYEEQWQAYCDSAPRVHDVSFATWATWLVKLLSLPSCLQRLAQGGLVDVLLLGCYTHRALPELGSLLNSPKSTKIPREAVRVVAFKDTIPTDACMVMLYSYRLASTIATPEHFREHVYITIREGLDAFQNIHLRWRDVDEAMPHKVDFADLVVMATFPRRSRT